MQLATVQIVNPKDQDSFLVINEADFEPARHVRWSERHRAAAAKEPEDSLSAWIAEQLKLPAAEVIAKVQAAPAEQMESLKAMRAAEAAGKARRTVLDAIDAQVAALTK